MVTHGKHYVSFSYDQLLHITSFLHKALMDIFYLFIHQTTCLFSVTHLTASSLRAGTGFYPSHQHLAQNTARTRSSGEICSPNKQCQFSAVFSHKEPDTEWPGHNIYVMQCMLYTIYIIYIMLCGTFNHTGKKEAREGVVLRRGLYFMSTGNKYN